MAEKDGKTEKASPKKLRDTRKKGEIPKSPDLTSAVTFIVFILAATFLGNYILKNSLLYLQNYLSAGFSVNGIENDLASIGMKSIVFVLVLAGPFLAIAFVAAFVASIVQTGFLFSAEPIKFKLNKINPISGFKNMFSKKTLFTMVKNVAKLTLVFWMAYKTLETSIYLILNSGNVGTEKLFFLMSDLVMELGTQLGVLLLILGLVDYIYQVYDYRKNLKMSKQELKDEYKESEGDPQIKSQRRQRYRQLTKGELKDVETATAIITNPTHLAIAIRYEKGKDDVPIIVAKGADHQAAKIRERAKAFDVPIIENKPVARAMYKTVEIGQPVPIDLYQAIAEILALVYQMEEINKNKI
ncbi:flagellar biosynthesis protein FlhB [Carnobacterium inhibens]|uniref:Flagellar biosynthetic protein FlhB n=1 Tax=Carnobacterium inhibens subsp. gilichinskyi TaxID=1266845 RepID=U5SBA1_9LACT|nr:flagellar biosynthesis protein FlhB [Carnobacterium inhibens]AGY82331.1 flagellar biosynthesis protein B [Carnobacterium inhibens subsp. gilichinskyi]